MCRPSTPIAMIVLTLTCGLVPNVSAEERFQFRFTGGLVLSKERQDFSNADPYLALNTEARLIDPADFDTLSARSHLLSALFDIRLTSIPVDAAVENQTPLPGQDLGAFLKSQKAAVVQSGLFYGFIPQSFKWEAGTRDGETAGTRDTLTDAFVIGPVAKFAFQSVTDKQKALRVWNRDDDLFDAWTVGGRIAWVRSDGKRRETLAYTDFTWGRFQNFETVVPLSTAAKLYQEKPTDDNAAGLTKADFQVSQDRRFAIESRLHIPQATAVYVGLDLNNGSGRDDLRFLFGLDFDIANLITQLKKK